MTVRALPGRAIDLRRDGVPALDLRALGNRAVFALCRPTFSCP
jgi:hypothetical protein